MKKAFEFAVSVALLLGVTGAQAANFASGQPLLCAVQSVLECAADGNCERLLPYEVNMPDFFLVDPGNRMLIGDPTGGVQRKTPIEYTERLDGRLILQGADDGIEGVRDGLAWSAAIDEETGSLIVTASGHGFAISAFGACTIR